MRFWSDFSTRGEHKRRRFSAWLHKELLNTYDEPQRNGCYFSPMPFVKWRDRIEGLRQVRFKLLSTVHDKTISNRESL